MDNRKRLANIAQNTLEILERGNYINIDHNVVNLKESLNYSIDNTKLYRPSELPLLNEKVIGKITDKLCKIEIVNCSTLSSAHDLVVNKGLKNVACLNFASAKNPGGGFLSGSKAQEESIARASGLYPTLIQMMEMYEYNRNRKSCLYSDYMIYSPKVPVFRDDSNSYLKNFYEVDIITAPAVNAGVVRQRGGNDIEKINEVMKERIKYIISVAYENGCKNFILGAYGCGVFRNDPEDVARIFKEVLIDEKYASLFDYIEFAILQRVGETKDKIFKDLLCN